MNNVIKNQAGLISELFATSTDVGIILGENQNVDTVAAALGLYLVLNASGKSVQIVSKKVPEVAVSNLFGVDKISQKFGGVAKIITISIPYHEEIEKVSYNIEGDRLNVNLFAEDSGINLDEKQIEYIRKGSTPGVIITVGVPDERELLAFVDPQAVRTIHIDINPSNAQIGDVSLIDPSFSSVSEIVAEMIRELNLGYDADGYQNLMDGIDFATRGFTSPSTSGYAFEAAGFLMQNGARRSEKTTTDYRPQTTEGRQEDRGQRSDLRPQTQDQRQGQGRRDDRRDRDRNRDRGRDRRDDRGRNFPDESHFLNQRPPRNQGGNQQQNQNQNRRDVRPQTQDPRNQGGSQFGQPQQQQVQDDIQNQPYNPLNDVQDADIVNDQFGSDIQNTTSNMDLNQAPKPYYDPRANTQTPTPREAQDLDMPSEYVDDSSTAEGTTPSEIPDDWFLPKVFKGSKKTNN